MTRTVLITGGAGFIGSNLVRRLVEDGSTRVRILDDLSSGTVASLDDFDVEVVIGSVLDPELLRSCMRDADAVVHLAAVASVPQSIRDPLRAHVVNVNGTLDILEEARRGGQHVIFASSSAVFGSNLKMPHDPQDWTRPISPYGAAKLAAEGYVNAYAATYGLPTLALRFFNVYGPGQRASHVYAAVIPRFIEAALADAPVEIHGDGLQSRDFIYVETVCDAIADALDRRLSSPDPVHLALGTATTVLDVVDELERSIGRSVSRIHVEERAGDVRSSQSAPGLMAECFPRVVPIDLPTGLARTLEWARTQHA
jgi:UDP-glucose 4-epimerase